MSAVSATEKWWLPGALAVLLLVLLAGLPLFTLISSASDLSLSHVFGNSYYIRVIWFSFYQALLSALLSVVLAIPVALSLSRERHFWGRQTLIHLYSLSLVIPTLVAIFGLVAVYGRTGWLNQILTEFGWDRFSIYGLSGILIAHIFFNMPLATRVFLHSLDSIPNEQWRLATQLRMSAIAQYRFIEWPAMKSQLVGLFMLIFTLCFTSFTIVLTLGGGPRATTIEVAIYQALRFDFDLNSAVSLAIAQLLICTVLLFASSLFKQQRIVSFGYQAKNSLFKPVPGTRWLNGLIISIAAGFVVLPLLGLMIFAINPATVDVLLHPNTIKACVNTVVISIFSAVIALIIGLGLLITSRHLRIRLLRSHVGLWLQQSGNVILAMPAVVLGTGLFLLLRDVADVFSIALVLAMIINSVMALPFVLRILDGPLMKAGAQHDRLVQSLGIMGWSRWRLIDWPLIRKPIGFALGISATLSAGDLSAIALFGSERALTLPLLLYQRMGGYRFYEAAATAVLLLCVCFTLFVLIQSLFGSSDNAEA
ncbi:MAG: thiamine/thiamine pyrophosphate ABC transporter permease [Gammaproteobacteria bacterium]|nr:thiamine/thiamine pyrophosphate ABC transporter permease [Gammaproteobacteria bacterium]